MQDERFLEYNILDSCCTLEARNDFWHELKNGYEPTYNRTMRLFEPLMFMQTRGLRVDLSAVEETKGEISKLIETKSEELNRLAGRVLNAGSPKDVATYFYIEKGVPAYTNQEGGVTTDDSALQRLAKPTYKRKGFKEAKLIQEIRGYRKLLTSYLQVVVDEDGRARCSWNPRGTKFGRLSSSETVFGTGLNLQNLHPLFKKFIWADPDYFLLEVDKRQAEWVIMAYLTQDAHMLKVVEQGKDPHVFTSSMMFNVPEEIVKLDNKLVGYERDPETIIRLRQGVKELLPFLERLPRNYGARQVGKHANHGLNYDERARRFSLEWELEESYSKWVIERYHGVYPGIRQWYKWVQEQLRRDRTLWNCFGRKMQFKDRWGDDLFKAAYSSLPQSTNVDGLNQGMCDIYDDPILCDSRWVNSDLMAQVHDSILLQIPVRWLYKSEMLSFWHIVQRIYDHVSPTMEYHNRQFKIATDSKVGWNWGAFHQEANSKGMQEVNPSSGPTTFVREVRECLGIET